MDSPTNVENNITQIPMKGVEEYCWFCETQLGEILRDYREGKLKKEEASEAIASVCTDRETYQLFHVIDVWKDGKPMDRRVFRSDSTMKKLLNEAKRHGWALLYRGMFFIPEEVWKEYKENYTTANRLEIFKLGRLTQTAPHILIDIDKDSFENLKRAVKYLHKLGIYPEVWESASGEGNYHVYIHLVGQVWRRVEKKKDGEEVEHRWAYLPYASDYRVRRSVEALKEIFRRLGIKYDSISATRAVWLEGFPNPEKGGKLSKKIWDGKVHRIDRLYEKLKPTWEGIQKEKAVKQFLAEIQPKKRRVEVRGTYEVVSEDSSSVIDYLQANIPTAFRMIDRGYTHMEAEAELRAGWTGDEKQFERAFPKFWDWVEATYKPLEITQKKEAKQKEKRKHLHYWEHIPSIRKVLTEDGQDSSLNHIHRRTGISKGTLSYIFRIVSREQILEAPEEAQELLKQYQKGGDRLNEDQKKALSERGKERFRRYMEKFLEEVSKKPRKPKKDKEERGIYGESIAYGSLKGVQIGSYSISLFEIRKAEDGLTDQTNRSLKPLDTGSKERGDYTRSFNLSVTLNNGRAGDDIVRRKVKGIPEELVRKHLEGKDPGPKHDPQDPLEKAVVKRALELIERLEQKWSLELEELPQRNYRRLIFGAVRRKGRTYDLGGWGRFAPALGEVLEGLGHRVIYPKPYEPKYELEEDEQEEEFSNGVPEEWGEIDYYADYYAEPVDDDDEDEEDCEIPF